MSSINAAEPYQTVRPLQLQLISQVSTLNYLQKFLVHPLLGIKTEQLCGIPVNFYLNFIEKR